MAQTKNIPCPHCRNVGRFPSGEDCQDCDGNGYTTHAACVLCDAAATTEADGNPLCQACRADCEVEPTVCRCGAQDCVGVDELGPACDECLSIDGGASRTDLVLLAVAS